MRSRDGALIYSYRVGIIDQGRFKLHLSRHHEFHPAPQMVAETVLDPKHSSHEQRSQWTTVKGLRVLESSTSFFWNKSLVFFVFLHSSDMASLETSLPRSMFRKISLSLELCEGYLSGDLGLLLTLKATPRYKTGSRGHATQDR